MFLLTLYDFYRIPGFSLHSVRLFRVNDRRHRRLGRRSILRQARVTISGRRLLDAPSHGACYEKRTKHPQRDPPPIPFDISPLEHRPKGVTQQKILPALEQTPSLDHQPRPSRGGNRPQHRTSRDALQQSFRREPPVEEGPEQHPEQPQRELQEPPAMLHRVHSERQTDLQQQQLRAYLNDCDGPVRFIYLFIIYFTEVSANE